MAETEESKPFACHICLDTASEPIVTVCGHLFCWSCISQWLDMPGGNACPVCKAGLKKENMVPIYGKGGDNVDPRERPARPNAQRPERENNYNGFHHFNDGFSFSFGPAVFSTVLGMQGFGTGFNFHAGGGVNPDNLTPEQLRQHEKEVFARMMFFMGLMILMTVFMV